MRARSSASARRSRWSTSGSARRATSQSRIYYGHEKTQAVGDHRRDRELGGGELRQGGDRAGCSLPAEVEHRRPGRRARQTPVAVAVPEHRSRSARRCGSAPTSSRSSACSASGRARAASRAAPTTSPSSRTARTRSSSARCSRARRRSRASSFNPAVFRTAMIAVVPREGHARRGDARSRGAHAHPPQASSSTSRTTSIWRRRTRC